MARVRLSISRGPNSLLKDYPGLANHLDRIFAVRLEHCFIGEDLDPAPDGDALLTLRQSLQARRQKTQMVELHAQEPESRPSAGALHLLWVELPSSLTKSVFGKCLI